MDTGWIPGSPHGVDWAAMLSAFKRLRLRMAVSTKWGFRSDRPLTSALAAGNANPNPSGAGDPWHASLPELKGCRRDWVGAKPNSNSFRAFWGNHIVTIEYRGTSQVSLCDPILEAWSSLGIKTMLARLSRGTQYISVLCCLFYFQASNVIKLLWSL